MAQIDVTYGSYNVEVNKDIKNKDNGIKVLTMDGLPLYSFANVHWWDKDAIITTLEENKEKILAREKEKRG